jgi:hypothetical protein
MDRYATGLPTRTTWMGGAQATRPSNVSIQTIPLLTVAGEVLAKEIVRIRFVFMRFLVYCLLAFVS